MTRQQLVNSLRVLHENDEILELKYNPKKRCINIDFISNGKQGHLLIAYATEQRLQTKSK